MNTMLLKTKQTTTTVKMSLDGGSCRIPGKRLIQREVRTGRMTGTRSHGGVMEVMRCGQFIVIK